MSIINSVEELILSLKSGTLLEHRYQNLELKENWHREDGKKISALGNRKADGSQWLCVGIKDNGELGDFDYKSAKAIEENISNHLNQFLDPIQTCKTISCHDIDEKWFIVIEIINPGAVVYWNSSAYKASGTTVAEMTPAEIMSMTVTLPGLEDYSAQQWYGDYDGELVKKFASVLSQKRSDTTLGSLHENSPSEILERIGIKDTNTVRILFGDFKFRVVYYDKNNNPTDESISKGLFTILTDGFSNHIQEWTLSQVSKSEETYPIKAIKEALANAVAHAAYFESRGDIIIEIFPGKLSISNLCLQESKFFANKWFSHSHKTVNRLLMEILRLAGFVDELGRGKTLIFSESLKNGKKPPQVVLEKSGRYDRWRLYLYDGTKDIIQLKLLSRLKETYPDEHKALIANALVLWKDQSVAEIRQYIDGESLPLFLTVLADINGPIFYYEKEDKIVLRRWTRILLGEGKDSKQLSMPEEQDLQDFSYDIQTRYYKSYITPKELRDLAGMGHTKSEMTISSNLLHKWTQEGVVDKIRKGVYRFVPKTAPMTSILELLQERLKTD